MNKEKKLFFEEFAFFDIGECDDSILEVKLNNGKGGGKKANIGSAEISILKLDQDIVLDSFYPLNHREKLKKKGEIEDVDIGNIHLRLILSTKKEAKDDYIRPLENDIYRYDEYKKKLKSGDVLLYSEVGVLSTVTKLLGNCEFSRAGMIIKIPNRYTEKIKFFVIELTRNFDKFVDAYTEKAEPGINIFRLNERIHQFSGESIYVLPLKEPLDPDPEINMIEWLVSLHSKGNNGLETELSDFNQSVWSYLSNFDFHHKNKLDIIELCSTEFMIKALIYGGRRFTDDEEKLIVPGDIIKNDENFSEPIPIRTTKEKNEE